MADEKVKVVETTKEYELLVADLVPSSVMKKGPGIIKQQVC